MSNHCKDCCCARLWAVLGITKYTGMSLVDHVQQLKTQNDHVKELLHRLLRAEDELKALRAELNKRDEAERMRKLRLAAVDARAVRDAINDSKHLIEEEGGVNDQ